MRRPLSLSLLFMAVDQLIKLYFQVFFSGKTWMVTEHFGFTYITNPGLWINPQISDTAIAVLQLTAAILWIVLALLLRYYHAFYRSSLLIDFSFAFFSTAVFGNTLDKLFFGYIRDYFINPIAISNLADICVEIALLFFLSELLAFPPARELLKPGTPKQWKESLSSLIKFTLGKENSR